MENVKRFDRIVSILIQLQSKKVVRAQELADRFQVSLRTIYRDIRSLESAGVALYGEAGSGYSIMEGYRLPPVSFSREEAGSFVAAEKLMKKFTDEDLGNHFGSAMYKVKSVLKSAEKEWVESLESRISIFSAQQDAQKFQPNVLDTIFESLATKKQLKLNYQSLQAEASSIRTVEAVGLFHENRFWYIYAYCHLRRDYRQFRIDRIKSLELLECHFSLKHPTLEELRAQKDETEEKTKLVLLVDKKIVKYLKYDRQHYGFVSEKERGNKMEMIFMYSGINQGFIRWYLMFADYALILEPESLKKEVLFLLQNYQKNLQ